MILHKRFFQGLAILTASTVMCMNAPTLQAKDDTGHWAQETLSEWAALGIIKGYEDGTIRPSKPMTRSELAAFLCRVFGLNYIDETINYTDVKEGAWYEQAIEKVMSAQLMNDYEDEFRPNQLATREEAAYALARAYHLSGGEGKSFVDSNFISEWAKEEVEALITSGYLHGRPDGTLAPQDTLTRADFVTMLDKLTAKLYQKPGTYTENISGNVVINTTDVILKDMTISGNLYIAEGVGEGDVTLENVKVEGHVIVEGGGEHSIEIKQSILKNVYVEKASGKVRVALDQTSKAEQMQLHSATQLEGKIGHLQVITQEEVKLVGASVENFQVVMADGKIEMDQTSNVEKLVVDATATISGKGKVQQTLINADDVVLDGLNLLKDSITIGSSVVVKPTINTTSGQISGGGGGGSSSGTTSGGTTTPGEEAGSGGTTTPEGGTDSGDTTTPEEGTDLEDTTKPGDENGSEDITTPEGDNESEDATTPGEETGSGDTTDSDNENESDDMEDTKEPEQVVESIQISANNKELLLGEESFLDVEVSLAEGKDQRIVWTSSDSKIVSVDATGKIIAKGVGEAIITVSTIDGRLSADCIVKVTGSVLSGKVTFQEGNIEDVQVLLYSEKDHFEKPIAQMNANKLGEYEFSNLVQGNYRIEAFYEDEVTEYRSSTSEVIINEAFKNLDMTCEKVTSFNVKVVDAKDDKTPILYVRILVEGKDQEGKTWSMIKYTNGAGEAKFILPDHIEKELTYTITKGKYEEMTYTYQVENLVKNNVKVNLKEENEPVYPEVIEHYAETEGTNTKGLGDTTYEALKNAGWRVESDTKLSTNNRRLIFENMDGVNGIDAKIIYDRSGFEDDILDYDMVLQYMIRKQSSSTAGDLTFEALKQKIANGTGPHQDAKRTIDVIYDGKVDGIVEIVFSNYVE